MIEFFKRRFARGFEELLEANKDKELELLSLKFVNTQCWKKSKLLKLLQDFTKARTPTTFFNPFE